MAKKLKFVKMWEAANTLVSDIDPGSIRPILETLPKVASFADKHWLYFYRQGLGAAYYEEKEMQKAKAAGLKDFQNSRFCRRYFSGIHQLLPKQEKFSAMVDQTDLRQLSLPKLRQWLRHGFDLNIQNFGYYLACQPQCVAGLEEAAQKELRKIVPKKEMADVFPLLCAAPTLSTLQKEEIKRLALLIRAKKNKAKLKDGQFLKTIKTHWQKHRLLEVSDDQAPATFAEYLNRLTLELSAPLTRLQAGLSKVKNSGKQIRKRQNMAKALYQITSKALALCQLLGEIGYHRLEMRVRGWAPTHYCNQQLVKEVAKRLGYHGEQFRFATITEIEQALDGKRLPKKLLRDRSQSFLYLINGKSAKLTGGQKAVQKFQKLVPLQNSRLANVEIRGHVATSGFVKGRAIIFKWNDKISEKTKLLQKDSILVAGQTRPQLLPLLAKCKAIITDEGGITSHAAIVSRELGIPCIIGTKIATQILKDGDLVEVDANRGIIKIIK